ncbi:alpha-ketoglutarate-dependent dioxygenase alkB isoform X2 [Daucus carota subsp. sativus]|uniref:alpha-ketoglutarate-dependent dioxygenase alkB isoform X2 n=1 Tax=Daucus carota subsp. sativus TaxID=79200 RepID=UPI0007EFCD97|nr:PREDICTED: alpha-ketoglutarate-dependent dioxygenase alkB isoform X2 [Daucus carota subsp. sativus]
MYGGGDTESERTAFRKAEKIYKLYYQSNTKKKKQPRAVDLTQVLDFKSIVQLFNANGQVPPGVSLAAAPQFDRPVFCLEKHPGFYFIPQALSVAEQCHWIRESLTSFPQPPNRTNHNAVYGSIHDLFIAAKERKVLVENQNCLKGLLPDNNSLATDLAYRWELSEEPSVTSRESTIKSISASTLLRKLRWSTLGLQFDWSKRSYNVDLPHNKIPDLLSELAKKMAAPSMSLGEEFQPEAAIVNYFGAGDMLGGHLDDMEADWSKPIVSMSLGCKAIFLLGGKSREDEPIAMFLRSGDIVLMAGEVRECFHDNNHPQTVDARLLVHPW